jgi:DNA-binding transcriptional LysR family regulator
MARAGRGIAWCPLSLIQGDLEKRDLIVAYEYGDAVSIEIRLWRSRSRQSPMAEAFWETVNHDEGRARLEKSRPSLASWH